MGVKAAPVPLLAIQEGGAANNILVTPGQQGMSYRRKDLKEMD